jgi:hypothetical protein
MKDSTKAALVGGLIGTFLMGPGLGTIVGAAVGLRRHFETKAPEYVASNDNDGDDEKYSSAV